MIANRKIFVMGTLCVFSVLVGCGKKSEDNASPSVPSYVAALALGSDAMGYGLKVLQSTNSISPTALTEEPKQSIHSLAESQDTSLPDCSDVGSPWDKTAGQRMSITNPKFSQTTFYCQLNSKGSPETLAGALNQYKAMLCDLERVIGTIDYTEAGTEYKDKSITITEECGWSARTVSEMAGQSMVGTVKAYAIATGDWQKQIQILVPSAGLDYNVYFTIKSELVAFRVQESWSQADRISGGDYNSNIPNTATGIRGSVISIDTTNGILRAESVDTYWSRRFRIFMQGVLDSTTGAFSSITDGQGVVSNFNYEAGLYGEIATAKGNSTDGYLHGNFQFSCSTACTNAIRANTTLTENTTSCSKSGGCIGNTGILFEAATADFDFMSIGAAWDAQGGKRTDVETWVSGAVLPTFTSVGKDVTP